MSAVRGRVREGHIETTLLSRSALTRDDRESFELAEAVLGLRRELGRVGGTDELA
jgi:hypothetical protein